MAYSKELLDKRNAYIHERYKHYKKRNPKWSWLALIQEVANEMFLSPSTIGRILLSRDEDVPTADTIIKYTRELAVA